MSFGFHAGNINKKWVLLFNRHILSPLPNLKMLNGIVNPGWIKRSLGSAFPCCFCTPKQNPFDNSQPFFHYVIGLLLWHSISQLRTAITTMHWETNGHLGGMPLQLYHLVTPGGHKCGMTACNSADGRLDVEKESMFENVVVKACDFVALITHAVSISGTVLIHTSFHSLTMVIC